MFQLSSSFYQRPNIPYTIFGDEMHSSSLELGRKRVELNVCESFKYFSQKLLRKYLKKQIFVFQKSNFTMKGASVKVAILSFFSQRSDCQKRMDPKASSLHRLFYVLRFWRCLGVPLALYLICIQISESHCHILWWRPFLQRLLQSYYVFIAFWVHMKRYLLSYIYKLWPWFRPTLS